MWLVMWLCHVTHVMSHCHVTHYDVIVTHCHVTHYVMWLWCHCNSVMWLTMMSLWCHCNSLSCNSLWYCNSLSCDSLWCHWTHCHVTHYVMWLDHYDVIVTHCHMTHYDVIVTHCHVTHYVMWLTIPEYSRLSWWSMVNMAESWQIMTVWFNMAQ